MMRRAIAGVFTAVALSAAPGMAQSHQRAGGADAEMGKMGPMMSGMMGGMMGSGMMGSGMMGSGMMGSGMMSMMQGNLPNAATILSSAEKLGLSADQVEQLQAIAARMAEERGPHMKSAMEAHQRAIASLGEESPDLAVYQAALSEATEHMVRAHLAQVQAGLDARAVLTDEQLEQVAGDAGHGGMMKGGMMGGGDAGRGTGAG